MSERIGEILGKANIKIAFKPIKTLGHIFKKPKEWQTKGIVYKAKCKSCPFTHIGESKRSWNSRGSEHNPGTRRENVSAIKQHAEMATHDTHSNDVEIKKKDVNNLKQRQFLESWHSEGDKNSINEKKEFPRMYKAFSKQNA